MSTSLAWHSLTHDLRRLAASVLGLGFAVVLMMVEVGFMDAIYASATLPVDRLAADLVMVSRLKEETDSPSPFPRRRLEQALAQEEVLSVAPVQMARFGTWHVLGQAVADKVRVFGVDPDRPIFDLPQLATAQRLLSRADTALVDRRIRDSYAGQLRPGRTGELAGRRIDLVGDFELGPNLQQNANLLVSELTFERCFPRGGPEGSGGGGIELGLLRLAAGADPNEVARQVEAALPTDVRVRTPGQLAAEMRRFWNRNQPVAAVFLLGTVVGFLIGLMICYQVLYTDVLDQLPQLATLKAIGYRNRYLLFLGLRRGALLALFALALGLPAGLAAFSTLENWTGLRFEISGHRVLTIAAATLVMCWIASLLAMRQALDADPAELY